MSDETELEELRAFGSGDIGYSELEHRRRLRLISTWPTAWGDSAHFLIADGYPLGLGVHTDEMSSTEFPEFGITITTERRENASIGPAVLGIASVSSKTLAGLEDAARRINELLGVLVLDNLGNCTLRWWCFLLHSSGVGGSPSVVRRDNLEGFLGGLTRLPEQAQRHTRQALYWIRVARGTNLDWHRMDVLRSFDAYWNTVECVSAAVAKLSPLVRSTGEIRAAIAAVHSELKARESISLNDVERLCRSARPVGERDRLVHAIEYLMSPSDEMKPEIVRFVKELYDARNHSKHGKVDVEEDEVLRKFERTLSPLRYLALELLFRLLGRKGFGGWPWIQQMRSRA